MLQIFQNIYLLLFTAEIVFFSFIIKMYTYLLSQRFIFSMRFIYLFKLQMLLMFNILSNYKDNIFF